MTNQKYSAGREYFAGDGDWDGDNFIALLVDSTLAFNDSHRHIDDITASIVSRSGNLTGKTITDGRCGCDDVLFAAVPSGHNVNLIIARDTTVDATSELVTYFDTGTNFPAPTVGIDMTFKASAVPYLFTT